MFFIIFIFLDGPLFIFLIIYFRYLDINVIHIVFLLKQSKKIVLLKTKSYWILKDRMKRGLAFFLILPPAFRHQVLVFQPMVTEAGWKGAFLSPKRSSKTM